jgi:predicted nucleic acid-binding protein
MVLVDTSVWIDYFNGNANRQSDRLDSLLGTAEVLIGDLILTELLQGFERDADLRRAKSILLELPYANLVGRDIALAAASNYRQLRARGITVRKTIGVLIATFCIETGNSLLHADKDFDALEKHCGLRVVHD